MRESFRPNLQHAPQPLTHAQSSTFLRMMSDASDDDVVTACSFRLFKRCDDDDDDDDDDEGLWSLKMAGRDMKW